MKKKPRGEKKMIEKELEELFEKDWIAEELTAKEEQHEWEQKIYESEIR